jgi:hypothetical protein
MKRATFVLVFAMLAFAACHAQDDAKPETGTILQLGSPSSATRANDPGLRDHSTSSSTPVAAVSGPNQSERFGVAAKFRYYIGETYLNPGFVTAPIFRASIRMANPPGHFPTAYPADWRQGVGGFGRNYGDAMAQRVSFQTARFVTGVVVREDPRYRPSASHNVFVRSLHAFGYTFIDRSDSGHRMPAFSNFVGAAAAGFVGNTYLPPGFANITHAGQRATLQLGFASAGNLYREFAPQMPRPLRTFFELIGR